MLRGESLAEKVSLMTVDDLQSASERINLGLPHINSTGSSFLKAVSASCKPIGHSNEAAAEARRKYFAMRDCFGPFTM